MEIQFSYWSLLLSTLQPRAFITYSVRNYTFSYKCTQLSSLFFFCFGLICIQQEIVVSYVPLEMAPLMAISLRSQTRSDSFVTMVLFLWVLSSGFVRKTACGVEMRRFAKVNMIEVISYNLFFLLGYFESHVFLSQLFCLDCFVTYLLRKLYLQPWTVVLSFHP